MLKDFKEFAMRGSVIDLAVGVVIGAAFGKIVSSLVDDILMPPIGRLLGHVDFSNLFILLDRARGHFETLADAKHDQPQSDSGIQGAQVHGCEKIIDARWTGVDHVLKDGDVSLKIVLIVRVFRLGVSLAGNREGLVSKSSAFWRQ